MFSVIIPLYNKSDYIIKAVNSVLLQTFDEFELIVVNDGSTDESLEKINNFLQTMFYKYPDLKNRIKIIDQINQGVSSARNKGVENSKFEYIAFLDADDWWDENFLLKMKQLIDTFPQAKIFASNYFKVKNSINYKAEINVEKDFYSGIVDYCDIYLKSPHYMPITSSSVVLSKNIFEQVKGFKKNIFFGEDFDLWIRIVLNYPFAFINEHLSYYNFDVENTIKSVNENKLFPPENHFIFNMGYLQNQEKENKKLKELLDKLRVTSLLNYRLKRSYLKEYENEIKKVNFKSMSKTTLFNYFFPIFLVNLFYKFKYQMYKIKLLFVKLKLL